MNKVLKDGRLHWSTTLTVGSAMGLIGALIHFVSADTTVKNTVTNNTEKIEHVEIETTARIVKIEDKTEILASKTNEVERRCSILENDAKQRHMYQQKFNDRMEKKGEKRDDLLLEILKAVTKP